jgi:hypothetical protein
MPLNATVEGVAMCYVERDYQGFEDALGKPVAPGTTRKGWILQSPDQEPVKVGFSSKGDGPALFDAFKAACGTFEVLRFEVGVFQNGQTIRSIESLGSKAA